MENPIKAFYRFCPNCRTPLIKKEINKKQRIVCPRCSFIFWNNPRPCVSVIIAKNKKILLLKRSSNPLKNYWCLPGGVVEYDENPEESAIREIKEETNLEIIIKRLVGVYLIDNDPRGNGIDIIYEGEIKGNNISISKEHSLFDFFSIEDLPALIAYKHREAINDFRKLTND